MITNHSQTEKSTLTIRLVLGVSLALIILISSFFVIKNNQVSNSEMEVATTLISQGELYLNISDRIILALNDTNYSSDSIAASLQKFERLSPIILDLNDKLGLSKNNYPIDLGISYDLSSKEFSSLVSLILNKRMESYRNQALIESRLDKVGRNYEDIIHQIQTVSFQKSASFQNITFIVLLIMIAGIIAVAIASYFLLFLPLSQVGIELLDKIDTEITEHHEKGNVVTAAEKKVAQTNTLLKVKSAQVLKLQESLELAIAYSNKTQKDKSLIYFNIASDLSEYIKVLRLQQQIIENQTSLEGNENWVTLTNTISQLNSLTGNYFNLAKNGHKNQQQGEVYLTQLMSEILISLDENSQVSFEQALDMPTIKTDIELLKRVLRPYFILMNQTTDKCNIKYSAKANGTFCEIKFLGLLPQFQNKLDELEKKELADFTFDEFKVHMANKRIEERGGKFLLQFEVAKTGLLTIFWPI